MKKELILKIAVVVILLAIVGLIIYKFVGKKDEVGQEYSNEPGVTYPSEAEINSFENKLREIVDSVNYVNQVFSATGFANEASYQNEISSGCFKFEGENKDMFINVVDTIYDNPFSKEGYFNREIWEDETGEDFYVCKPSSCTVKEITTSDVEVIDTKNDDEKKLKVGNTEYTMRKENDVWKLNKPIIVCE